MATYVIHCMLNVNFRH